MTNYLSRLNGSGKFGINRLSCIIGTTIVRWLEWMINVLAAAKPGF